VKLTKNGYDNRVFTCQSGGHVKLTLGGIRPGENKMSVTENNYVATKGDGGYVAGEPSDRIKQQNAELRRYPWITHDYRPTKIAPDVAAAPCKCSKFSKFLFSHKSGCPFPQRR
jgi:hypothetical protein